VSELSPERADLSFGLIIGDRTIGQEPPTQRIELDGKIGDGARRISRRSRPVRPPLPTILTRARYRRPAVRLLPPHGGLAATGGALAQLLSKLPHLPALSRPPGAKPHEGLVQGEEGAGLRRERTASCSGHGDRGSQKVSSCSLSRNCVVNSVVQGGRLVRLYRLALPITIGMPEALGELSRSVHTLTANSSLRSATEVESFGRGNAPFDIRRKKSPRLSARRAAIELSA
jgi:hypothetical protein